MVIYSDEYKDLEAYPLDKTYYLTVKDWYVNNEYRDAYTGSVRPAPCKDLRITIDDVFAYSKFVQEQANKYSDKGYTVYVTSVMHVDD